MGCSASRASAAARTSPRRARGPRIRGPPGPPAHVAAAAAAAARSPAFFLAARPAFFFVPDPAPAGQVRVVAAMPPELIVSHDKSPDLLTPNSRRGSPRTV